MIDTIKIKLGHDTSWPSLVKDSEINLDEWKCSEIKYAGRSDSGVLIYRITKVYQHLKSGCRLTARDDGSLVNVEVSLPKLIYPSNGTLIRTQEQLNAATSQLLALISEIAPDRRVWFTAVKRADLVWQFVGDIHSFVNAYSLLKHDAIEAYPNVWLPSNNQPERHKRRDGEDISAPNRYVGATGLSWRGSHLIVNIYDKLAELGLRRYSQADGSSVVRVEFRMIGGPTQMSILCSPLQVSFSACYEKFRTLCEGFVAPIFDAGRGSSRSFLLEKFASGAKGFDAQLLHELLHWLSIRSRQRFSRNLKMHNSLQVRLPSILDRLPSRGPPCSDGADELIQRLTSPRSPRASSNN